LSFSLTLGTAGHWAAWYREQRVVTPCEFAHIVHVTSGKLRARSDTWICTYICISSPLCRERNLCT